MESSLPASVKRAQRLISIDLLYRTYIAVDFPNRCRILLLEIPQKQDEVIKRIKSSQGLKITVEKTGQELEGCTTCFILSTDPKYNEVFEVVAEDIVNKLVKVNSDDTYTQIIYQRICIWQEFFNRKNHTLSSEEIIGLIGELRFLEELLDAGICYAIYR